MSSSFATPERPPRLSSDACHAPRRPRRQPRLDLGFENPHEALSARAPFQEPLESPHSSPSSNQVSPVRRIPFEEVPSEATQSPIQFWMSPATQKEEEALFERKLAYHERRQAELEASGAPKCYKCGWFGHIARACRNSQTEMPARGRPVRPSREGVPSRHTLADFLSL